MDFIYYKSDHCHYFCSYSCLSIFNIQATLSFHHSLISFFPLNFYRTLTGICHTCFSGSYQYFELFKFWQCNWEIYHWSFQIFFCITFQVATLSGFWIKTKCLAAEILNLCFCLLTQSFSAWLMYHFEFLFFPNLYSFLENFVLSCLS
jgi:hypothetical protein